MITVLHATPPAEVHQIKPIRRGQPITTMLGESYNQSANLAWIASAPKRYGGLWVFLAGGRLIGHGTIRAEATAESAALPKGSATLLWKLPTGVGPVIEGSLWM